jgi:hypothetical protein
LDLRPKIMYHLEMPSILGKRQGGQTYYYLVESARVGRRAAHRVAAVPGSGGRGDREADGSPAGSSWDVHRHGRGARAHRVTDKLVVRRVPPLSQSRSWGRVSRCFSSAVSGLPTRLSKSGSRRWRTLVPRMRRPGYSKPAGMGRSRRAPAFKVVSTPAWTVVSPRARPDPGNPGADRAGTRPAGPPGRPDRPPAGLLAQRTTSRRDW